MGTSSLETLASRCGLDTFGPAMRDALAFLDAHDAPALLERVGQTIEELRPIEPLDKRPFQRSYVKDADGPDDLLAGRGIFYITERRRLCLDGTAGHYQMLWGYQPSRLLEAIAAAGDAGVVWDNHTNIPQWPVKRLAHRLLEFANAPGTPDPLDTVLLGCCTGSNACGAALKMQLLDFEHRRGDSATPAVVVLDGNYHGTDMVAQRLRGMWPRFVANLDVIAVGPNDPDELRRAFADHGQRIAAFWAEPVMMNREAIPLERPYLELARGLCDESGAALCLDEIQTGFWCGSMFACRSLGVAPDMLIVGKGMTAGFHPQAAVLYKRRYDRLAQYDAISTNGSAALPCFVALCVMELVAEQAEHIDAMGERLMSGMASLASAFGDRLFGARGRGHLVGLKFREVADALATHQALVERGLWVRVHAYHEGHSTILLKPALAADAPAIDFIIDRFRDVLRGGGR